MKKITVETEKDDARIAFNKAIREGRLSANPEDILYAGHYMFMGRVDGKDMFKNTIYRNYLP